MEELGFKVIDAVYTSEKASAQLAELIRSNKLKPGDKLPPEQSLAQALGISRATVREALTRLKTVGLIVSYTGKGNFVADSSIVQDWDRLIVDIRSNGLFADAIESRRALEGEICYLAAQRGKPAQLEAIRTKLVPLDDIASPEAFRNVDYEFHHALAVASGNQLFIRFIEECFVNLSEQYWQTLGRIETASGRVFSSFFLEHRSIFEAIESRDAERARNAMIDHIETIRCDFLKALKS